MRKLALETQALATHHDNMGSVKRHDSSFILGINGVLTESVTSKIAASGGYYVHKLLRSTPANWRTIVELLGRDDLSGVVAKFHGGDYARFLQPGYERATAELLAALGGTRHLVLVHEAVAGTPPLSPPTDEDEDVHNADGWNDQVARMTFGEMDPTVQSRVNDLLEQRGITVTTYKRGAEASVMATAFVGDLQDNLIFRIYVPAGRIYEEELARLLGLFHHWLNAVKGANVRQGGYQTASGRVIEFFGEGFQVGTADASAEMAEFNEFLGLLDDPGAAAAMLVGLGVDPAKVDGLVTRYAREARRVLLDARHERDRKMLAIQQQLEADLSEQSLIVTSGELASLVAQLVPLSPLAAPSMSGRELPSGPSVTINSQVFHHVQGVVTQHLNGDVQFGTPLDEIVALIRASGDPEQWELEGAAHQLGDDGAPKAARLTARQRLKAFLLRNSARLEASVYQEVWDWLQKQVGG